MRRQLFILIVILIVYFFYMKKYPPRTHKKGNRVNRSVIAAAVPFLMISKHRHSPMPIVKGTAPKIKVIMTFPGQATQDKPQLQPQPHAQSPQPVLEYERDLSLI